VRAVRALAAGEAVFGAGVAARIGHLLAGRAATVPFPLLTARERQVLDLVARGMRNGGIAGALHLAPKTISNHISAIFAKLGVADRAAAADLARTAGLGRPHRPDNPAAVEILARTPAPPEPRPRPGDRRVAGGGRESFPGRVGAGPLPAGVSPRRPSNGRALVR
jgi:DNA-binding CsgD family transcriptional regulator